MLTQDDSTAARASIEDVIRGASGADALVTGVLRLVMRQRRSIGVALDYVKALSRDTRANCWDLAERAGHAGPHRMQALLRTYKWSWEELPGELPALAAACLPDDGDDEIGPGLAIDETAHLKKGKATACAAPQHAGVTGKVENCVTWVFAALVTACGQEARPATMTYFITIAGRRWPAEVTFKTAKDTLGWDQSQARTYDAVNRHTALTALAQLRAIAVRGSLAGDLTLPDAPAAGAGTSAVAAGEDDAGDADLQIPLGGAPLPVSGGQPCPPGIPPIRLPAAEAARLERFTRDYAAGLLTRARLAFHYRWSTWRRRHQARARWHHYSTRLQALAT